MPETGKLYEADIIDTALTGNGIAKVDGAVVFVHGGVAGDRCTIKINEKRKNYFLAEAKEYINLSDNRASDDCPYYGRCGGCTLRHVNYSHECKIKESAVRKALEKAGADNFVLNPIKTPSPDKYRNKAVFHFDGNGNAGYYAEGTRDVIPLTDVPCRIVPEEFCRIAQFCAENLGNGADDSVTVRKSTEDKIAVAFDILGTGRKIPKKGFSERLMAEFHDISGVFARSNVRQEYELISGKRHITNKLCGIQYMVSADAFFQVNYEGAEMMFSEVERLAGNEKLENIFDLFCGTGSIGIFLAARHPEATVTGIEINSRAVENAKMNAALNLTENASFRCGDASEYAVLCKDKTPDLTVIDPPRSGCSDKTLSALLTVMPKRIIYVSCNPFTLARDVSRLEAGGYRLTEATPVNMFPRSEHVECVVSMTKNNNM